MKSSSLQKSNMDLSYNQSFLSSLAWVFTPIMTHCGIILTKVMGATACVGLPHFDQHIPVLTPEIEV